MKTKTIKNNELEVVFPGQINLLEEEQQISILKPEVEFFNLQKLASDYEQYVNLTKSIKGAVAEIFDRYLEIGYKLIEIKDKELFKLAGYENIFDYAKENFELSKTTVNNVTSIISKFCDEKGRLLEKFENYSYSTLVEMISVKQLDLKNYTPAMTVKEIRLQKVVDKINLELENQFGETGFLSEIIKHACSMDFNKNLKTTAFELTHESDKQEYEDKLDFKILFTLFNKISKQKIKFRIVFNSWRSCLQTSMEAFYYSNNDKYFYFSGIEIKNLKDFSNWLKGFQDKLVESKGAILSEEPAEKEKKKGRTYESIVDYSKRKDSYRDASRTFFANILAEKFKSHFLDIPNQREIHVFEDKKISKKNPPAFKIINYNNPLELIIEYSNGNKYQPANLEELFAKEVSGLLEKLKTENPTSDL